jgi:hypothetical protein
MIKKIVLSVAGLAAAGAVPYMIVSGPQHFSKLREVVVGAISPAQPAAETPLELPPQSLAPAPAPLLLEGPPMGSLAEVLRFDVSPDWIMRRWPRVSSGLADVQLQGYRVPLVTGTRETDLAGSLTYYFNPQQQVQRITFAGTTGNIGQLAAILQGHYRLARRATNDPGLIVFEGKTALGQPASTARIRTAPILRAGDLHGKYEVQMTLERPA